MLLKVLRDLDFCRRGWECTGDRYVDYANKQKNRQLSTSKTAVSLKKGNLIII